MRDNKIDYEVKKQFELTEESKRLMEDARGEDPLSVAKASSRIRQVETRFGTIMIDGVAFKG